MKVNKFFHKGLAGGAFTLLLLCTFARAEVFSDFAQALDGVAKTAVSAEASGMTEESFKDLKIDYDFEEMRKIFQEIVSESDSKEDEPKKSSEEREEDPSLGAETESSVGEEKKSGVSFSDESLNKKTESKEEKQFKRNKELYGELFPRKEDPSLGGKTESSVGEEGKSGVFLVPAVKEPQSPEIPEFIEEKKETKIEPNPEAKKLPIDEQLKFKKEQKKSEEKTSEPSYKNVLKKTEKVEKTEEKQPGEKTIKVPEKEKNNSKIHTLEEYAQWKEELIKEDKQLINAIKAIPPLQRDNVLLTTLFGEKEPTKILSVTEKLREAARAGLKKSNKGKALSALKFTDEKTAKTAILAFGRVEPLLIEDLIKIWRAKSGAFEDKKGYGFIEDLFSYTLAIFKYYFQDLCNKMPYLRGKAASDARADINRVLMFYKTISPLLREAKVAQDEARLLEQNIDSGEEKFIDSIESILNELRTLCEDPCIQEGLGVIGFTKEEVEQALKSEKSNRVWCRAGNYVFNNEIKEDDKEHTPETTIKEVIFSNGNILGYKTETDTNFVPGDPEKLGLRYYMPFNFDVERIQKIVEELVKNSENTQSIKYQVLSMQLLNAVNTLVGYALSDSTCPVCFTHSLALDPQSASTMSKYLQSAENIITTLPESVSREKALMGIKVLLEIIKKQVEVDDITTHIATYIDQPQLQEEEQNKLSKLLPGIQDTRLINGCFWVRRFSKNAKNWLNL
ncbi:MAG: hypothetical protein UV38_C0001G0094 [candidate division TM6 bacterium GW2011_GWE2_42_60]|nr:MAG: hypothetical protein UV38_C0001G0094 [candidate division TM6 bacterium GW2011_GWE2_42_60]HBY05709.1 hypothetical protein [Candidatus Dependentiae bacterium]